MAERPRRAYSANSARRNVAYESVSGAVKMTGRSEANETSPLLENMESVVLAAPTARSDAGAEKQAHVGSSSERSEKTGNKMTRNDDGERRGEKTSEPSGVKMSSGGNGTKVKGTTGISERRDSKKSDCKSEMVQAGKHIRESDIDRGHEKGCSERETVHDKDDESGAVNEERLDIVRKISELGVSKRVEWRRIGTYRDLQNPKCQRLYAKSRRADDVALFFANGRYFAMEAWCSHMGGPLFEGDIEDYNGRCHVMCPWHSYMFDLETGRNEIGLQQKMHEVKYEDGSIYIRYHTELSQTPTRKVSNVIQAPPAARTGQQASRKDSVLESPISLQL